jgi:hypothetical protein
MEPSLWLILRNKGISFLLESLELGTGKQHRYSMILTLKEASKITALNKYIKHLNQCPDILSTV